uniref:Uncharacterized protein n=1 Tax=Oryza nivara TaxID=4536 RepID=A0A0E0G2U0_ORYNI
MGSNHFPFGPRYFRPDPVRARPNKLSRRLLDSRSSARHRRLHFSAGAAATATATVPRAPEKAPRRIYVRWPPTSLDRVLRLCARLEPSELSSGKRRY